jgi:glutamyl-tRNA synthetase
MILGEDGKRLSKRHGAVSVLQYREDGFLPEALLNYLVRLGWSHGDQEIFSISELIQYFEMTHINRAPAAINQDKLLWLNQYYMKNSDRHHVAKELAWHMARLGVEVSNGPDLTDIVALQAERTKTLKEMAERSRYFYEDVNLSDEMRAHFTSENAPALIMLRDRLKAISSWSKETIHEALTSTVEIHGLKLGKLAQPVRIALTGGIVSPSLDSTMALLGQNCVLKRLDAVFSDPSFASITNVIDKHGDAP